MSTINSFLQLDSSQYAQVPIGATRVATKATRTFTAISYLVSTAD